MHIVQLTVQIIGWLVKINPAFAPNEQEYLTGKNWQTREAERISSMRSIQAKDDDLNILDHDMRQPISRYRTILELMEGMYFSSSKFSVLAISKAL